MSSTMVTEETAFIERRSSGPAEGPGRERRQFVNSYTELSPDAAFFTTGDGPRIVYCPRERATALRDRLGDRATVVGLGEDCVTMAALVEHLGDQQGMRSLMVEGGGTVLTQFLSADLVDELHLVVAPFFVGEARAPVVFGGNARKIGLEPLSPAVSGACGPRSHSSHE